MNKIFCYTSILLMCAHLATAQWESVASGTTSQLNTIRLVDASKGWISSHGGKVLKTFNGGASWTT